MHIEDKFTKYISREQFDEFRKDQFSKLIQLQKDLENKDIGKNTRRSSSLADNNIYLKEETFYNDKVELESKIATL